MGSWAATLAYGQHNEVGEGLSLATGFFDCGHGWGAAMKEIGAEALLRLFRKQGATGGRELVLVDGTHDSALREWTRQAVRELKELQGAGATVQQLTLRLAKRVSDRMGGHGAAAEQRLSSGSAADIDRIRREGASDIIPLGQISMGVCRHRAVLFKFVADSFNEAVRREALESGGRRGGDATHPTCFPGTGAVGAAGAEIHCRLSRGRFVGCASRRAESAAAGGGMEEAWTTSSSSSSSGSGSGNGRWMRQIQEKRRRPVGHAWNQIWCPVQQQWMIVDSMHNTGACPYNRPCAQQYVGKSQSCMVISGRLIVHAPV